ncbi:DDE-Tnp-IS1595 domain-containing protein [Aphelenchoides besseyi]|nr:DDE-Tnp-IS1595 domain-containing protein [Aphelenchoides besseyi]
MDELIDFTSADLYEKLKWDDENFIACLQHLKLLFGNTRPCVCGGKMTIRPVKAGRRYGNYRCTTKDCRKEKGFLTDTFFEGAHLELKEIFQLSYFWCFEMSSHKLLQFQMKRADHTTIGEHTLVDYKDFLRDVCVEYFVRNPIRIGGEGCRVQIDEAFVTKRKYNKGRLVNEAVMIFGGIEEETGECFIWPMERRDSETLLALIQKYIMPGTTIISDCWRAYGGIANLPEGY